MNTFKYTPAPWKVGDNAWVFGANGETVLSHHPMTFIDEQMQADAHLIAAAPELLAACKRMVAGFWGEYPEKCRASFRRDYPRHGVCQAEVAIAKAEGVKP